MVLNTDVNNKFTVAVQTHNAGLSGLRMTCSSSPAAAHLSQVFNQLRRLQVFKLRWLHLLPPSWDRLVHLCDASSGLQRPDESVRSEWPVESSSRSFSSSAEADGASPASLLIIDTD